jgi:hypothetical protein
MHCGAGSRENDACAACYARINVINSSIRPAARFRNTLSCREDDIMRTSRLFSGWLFVLIAMIAVVLPASGREKSDVVILKNGDRITCEVKRLARGMLTVNTDSMSTVQIKWQDVESITTKFLFTVQDVQGELYVGSLQATAEARHMSVTGSRPASNLENLSVVQMQELEASRWKRFSGSADLGSSFNKASDRRQFNFSGNVSYRTERYSSQLSYSSTIGSSKGAQDANREILTLDGTRQISGKWLAFSQASLEHNLELQLDRRFSFLGGPGYRIAQSNRSLVTATGAIAFTRESYYSRNAAKNVEGYFGINTQFFKLYSPKFDITNGFTFRPNFTTWGRRRLEFNTKLRIEVLRDFFVSLTFYDSYDSRPPSTTAAKNDYGFTTGFSWSFRR